MKNITYRQLPPTDIPDTLLENYTRYQETTQVLVLEDGKLIQKEIRFIDDWDAARLKEVCGELRTCVQNGGIVLGAFDGETCIGFTMVKMDRFGSRNQYVELPYCHVTREFRGKGVGRILFQKTCDIVKASNVEKLYISTHPSVEAQGFYRSMGCVLAEEINDEILAHEPYDIQLEKTL